MSVYVGPILDPLFFFDYVGSTAEHKICVDFVVILSGNMIVMGLHEPLVFC